MKRIIYISLLVLATAVLPASASAGDASDNGNGNAVTRWAGQTLDAVRDQNVGTPNAGRLYAMVFAAMYDAVNGIDRARHHRRTPALVSPAGAPAKGQRDVAAAAAAHAVLSAVLSADRPPVSGGSLDVALDAEVAAVGGEDDRGVGAGRDWGRHVGGQVVALRAADGTETAQTIAACSPFQRSPDLRAGRVPRELRRALAQHDALRDRRHVGVCARAAAGAQRLDYAAAFEDVRTCGSNDPSLDGLCADATTPAQRDEISNFWLAEGGTARETGTWVQAALAIAAQQGTVKSTSATARLFALVAMATADAVKVAWATKAAFFTWRPTTAIHLADTDANPATSRATDWTSRIGAVGGSPEYTSGTSTFAGAASVAIEDFYCHDTVAFSFQTDLASSGPRSYASPLEAAREAGRSRIFQGIHFEFSNDAGRRAGRAIGREIVSTKLLPSARPRARPCRP